MFLSVILLCCVVWAWWRLKPQNNGTPPKLPGALPFIGHAHQLLGDRKSLWKFIRRIQMDSLKQGGVAIMWVGPLNFYILTDPIESIAVANHCLEKAYVYRFGDELLKNGLITAEESVWKPHRKLLNLAFNPQVLNTFVNVMNEQSRLTVSKLALHVGKGPIAVRDHFSRLLVAIVTRTSLGLDNNQEKVIIDTEYAAAFQILLDSFAERFQKAWLHISFIFNWSKMKRTQDGLIRKIKNITNKILHERKAKLKAEKNLFSDETSCDSCESSAPGKFRPLLDLMLQLAEVKKAFTDDDIIEHMSTFVLAAFDTTSTSITMTLIMLGSYQEVQERVFNELREVLEEEDSDLNKQHLSKLVYLEAVIKETIRLYPMVPTIARNINKDVKFKNYTLRAGSIGAFGLYAMLRHPIWGADAEQFRPERWLDPAHLPDPAYRDYVFGIGKRNCIGKVYSLMVMKIALAHILQRYQVFADINTIEFETTTSLKPVNENISFSLRK